MSEPSDAGFQCPVCGKQYDWNPAWASKKVQCTCGSKLKLPAAPGGEIAVLDAAASTPSQPSPAASAKQPPDTNPSESYELNMNDADDSPPAKSTSPQASPPTGPAETADAELDSYELDLDALDEESPAASPAADSRLPDESASAPGSPIQTKIDTQNPSQAAAPETAGESPSLVDQQKNAEEPAYVNEAVKAARREEARKAAVEKEHAIQQRRNDVIYPTALLVSGPIIILLMSLLIGISATKGLETAGIELIVMAPLLFLAVLIGATLLKHGFGTLGKVLFKCAAISVGPGSFADLLGVLIITTPVIWAVLGLTGFAATIFFLYLIFVGWPMSKLFDLDFQESVAMVSIVVFVRMAAILLFAVFLYK